ncbi:MAG: hypothetical protein PHT29_07650, partial [Eubacteriales bacterium]|nr:hypothetical protein [Eubacteriales bacterium]
TLHDIGKVGVAEQILKKPDKLTSDEWIEMKKHPEIGYRIAMSHEEALAEIKRCAGTQFDPSVAQVFMDAVNSGE